MTKHVLRALALAGSAGLVVMTTGAGMTGVAAGVTPAPSASAPPPSRAASTPSAPTPTFPEQTVGVGKSPTSPDPRPPLGGHAPDGTVVGGAQLLRRSVITAAGSPALPSEITAKAYMVTDLDTGQILAARDPHGRYQPASVLKLLTAITVLPKLPGNEVVTAGPAAANAEGSAVGLVPGGRYTVDTLFKGLLLASGNDTAVALAQAAGGVRTTVAAMNAEADALGAYDTLVQTPSGLDGWQQLTSAYDLTLILRAAVDSPRLLAYDQARTATLPAQHVGSRRWGPVPLSNQSDQFFDHVKGALLAKIGYTDAAQHTYVCATERGGRRIGVVLLRAQRQPIDQWQQASRLLDWAYQLPRSDTPVGQLVGPATQTSRPSVTSSATTSAADRPAGGAARSASDRPTPNSAQHPPSQGLRGTRAEILVFLAIGAAFLALLAVGARTGKNAA